MGQLIRAWKGKGRFMGHHFCYNISRERDSAQSVPPLWG